MNAEEAISQDEYNNQLAKLNGLSDRDIDDSKKLFNDLILNHLNFSKDNEDELQGEELEGNQESFV